MFYKQKLKKKKKIRREYMEYMSYLILRLSRREELNPAQAKAQGRTWKGYDPSVSMEDLCEVNSKHWRLGSKAREQDAVLFVYDGKVVAAMHIKGLKQGTDGRSSIIGNVAQPGDSLYERWLGQEPPCENKTLNPVSYCSVVRRGSLADVLAPLVKQLGGVQELVKWLEEADRKGLFNSYLRRE